MASVCVKIKAAFWLQSLLTMFVWEAGLGCVRQENINGDRYKFFACGTWAIFLNIGFCGVWECCKSSFYAIALNPEPLLCFINVSFVKIL